MRIAFLCGSLEPGRDGVGDYTRLLAAECARQGAPSAMIALNDPFVSQTIETGSSQSDAPCLRLSARGPWSTRIAAAADLLNRFQPDWVSLQFVCYGYHPKGLAYLLGRRLEVLIARRPLHIMFHELWVGESTSYGWKDRAIGLFQKRIVLGMAARLKPRIVHTNIPVYRHLLASNGIAATELPLFGNIPVASAGEGPLAAELLRNGLDFKAADSQEYLIVGIFGTVHPQWDPEPFLDRLVIAAREIHRRPLLLAFGRIGADGEKALASIKRRYGGDLPCINLGEHPAGKISQFLQALDFGIVTSPWALVGKSGTAAAMLDHGIPVVASRDDWKLRSGHTPPPTWNRLLFQADDHFWSAVKEGLPKPPPAPRISDVARLLIQDFVFQRAQQNPAPLGSVGEPLAPSHL